MRDEAIENEQLAIIEQRADALFLAAINAFPCRSTPVQVALLRSLQRTSLNLVCGFPQRIVTREQANSGLEILMAAMVQWVSTLEVAEAKGSDS